MKKLVSVLLDSSMQRISGHMWRKERRREKGRGKDKTLVMATNAEFPPYE